MLTSNRVVGVWARSVIVGVLLAGFVLPMAWLSRWQPTMPKQELAIRCPATGMPVATGEVTNERVLPRSSQRRIMANCPACGRSHIWQHRDAWMIPETKRDVEPDENAELL